MSKNLNSFNTASTFTASGKTYSFHSLKAFTQSHPTAGRLPYSLKVLLENLLRHEDGVAVKKKDIEALAGWKAKAEPDTEIQFMPARVLLQDFTGVPAVADLAAMRNALKKLGGDPNRINPRQPSDLVIDHSVQVDEYGSAGAFKVNADLEFERNEERYQFLRWGQNALKNFRVVPPDTGICHQVNLEYLSHVAMVSQHAGDGAHAWIYPDTLVGTDSHTTMINGLGCLGWGVGGIEAEAAMLGQPCSMLIPQVVGFKLTGKLAPGATATDLVLTVTQMLRQKGVVGKFVEFFGPGLASLSLADRATIGNMAPEYGATAGLFPVDRKTMEYLTLTGRGEHAKIVEAYFKEQGMWYDATSQSGAGAGTEPEFTDTLELDLGSVEPCIAGPARPQDRVVLKDARRAFRRFLVGLYGEKLTAPKDVADKWAENADLPREIAPELSSSESGGAADASLGQLGKTVPVQDPSGAKYQLGQGSIVIAAITSCTNTSNPSVLMAAGLLAKNAAEKGMKVRPWVKTSLAPGSKVVTDYLTEAGLMPSLEKLRFHLVGYGCTTCIGNSGPLPDHVAKAVVDGDLAVAAVLSGNRNFEGRINNLVRANYLASPPLVVAYALAGNININLTKDPLGLDDKGQPVFLKDIWPSHQQIAEFVSKHVTSAQFKKSYSNVFDGDAHWKSLKIPTGDLYKWEKDSTYIKEPPFFENLKAKPEPVADIRKARVLALFGDSITTDHISPAGSIGKSSPAGHYLVENGVEPKDFNSYGARRGNHEVMVRGTFANVRLKNHLVPGVEGGVTTHMPSNKQMTIFDASMQYQADGVPLIVIAGKEYGTGSSRDWAAKGPRLLGIRAVIAESFERIHRSNLIGMGILPLQFMNGETYKSLGLTGKETFDIEGLSSLSQGQRVSVKGRDENGNAKQFTTLARIDTPNELEYFRNSGILQYVLRQTLGA